jgi:hypothetical protein
VRAVWIQSPRERTHSEERRAVNGAGGDHAMARGVFESVLDLKRSVALREGAMQKLGGVFKRRRPYARRTKWQHTRAARKFLGKDRRPGIRDPIERRVPRQIGKGKDGQPLQSLPRSAGARGPNQADYY